MFETTHNTLASLFRRGLLQSSDLDLAAVRRQLHDYEMLLERSHSNSEIRSFLAEYDALMRLVEVILICSGFRLGPQPHRVLKDVVDSLVADSRILEISEARHGAKKMSINPRPSTREQLGSIRRLVEAEVEREIYPLLNN